MYKKTTTEIQKQSHQDSIKTEKRITENITTYAQETQQAEQAQIIQKQQHREVLRKQFEKEMNPYYEEAITQMKKQQYAEIATTYAGKYYQFIMPYLQSITTKYPPLSDSMPSEETTVAYEIFTNQHKTIDSLRTSLPSIETLPPAQRDSLMHIIEQLSHELGY